MKRPLTLAILFLFTFRSFAQETWDWKKCIDYALANNLQLQAGQINAKLAEVEVKRNRFNYSPNVFARTNYSLGIGNNYNYFSNQYERQTIHYNDYNLNVIQPVFDGMITPNSAKKSQYDLQALRLDNEVLASDIQLQILTAFLNILNAEEQYKQAESQKKNTQEQHDRTQVLIDAGSLPQNSIVDIDAQLAAEDATLQQVKNQLDLAYLALKLILQLDPDKEIRISAPALPDNIELATLPASKDIFATAVGLRPEIKSRDLRILSAQRQVKIANGSRYPTLNFTGTINTFFSSQNRNRTFFPTGNNVVIGIVQASLDPVIQPEYAYSQERIDFYTQFKNLLSYAIGLQLNIPIYNKNQVNFAVKQAKLNVQLAELQKKQEEQNLHNNIKQAYAKALNAAGNYQAAQVSVDAAQQSYDYNLERVNGGLASQLELNLAKNNLAAAQSRLTQAKYEYLFNSKVLDFYQGKPINLE